MIKLIQKELDYSIFFSVAFLIAIGVLMIYSVGSGGNVQASGLWGKQLFFGVISLFAMVAVIPIPKKFFYAFAYVFYAVGIITLFLTDIFGTISGGSERWLTFAGFRVQPSEFMKIATILALSRFLSEKKNKPDHYRKCIIPFLIIGVPMVLVEMQPDLGTALVFGSIVLPALYWAGLDKIRIFFLVSPVVSGILTAPFIPHTNAFLWVIFMFLILAVLYYSRYNFVNMGIVLSINIIAGIAIPYIFNKLEIYQQKRITSIFNPEADPLSTGYQIINSKIAIGSGGVFGKGLSGGRYTELGFLPNAHTDFIFSVIGEKLGFIGATIVLLVIFYIVYRAIMLATENKNSFSSLIAIGVASVFTFHMFVNVGMVLGIMPVTGIPLPFISAGGSACLANSIMIGLLLNLKANLHEF